jgi:hypothetical protein
MRKFVGGDARAFEAFETGGQTRHHVAVLNVDLRTHGLQAFDVLIHWARADGAPPGQRHAGTTEARQQGAEHQDRGAHGFDQLIRRIGVDGVGRLQDHATALTQGFGLHTHVVEQLAHGRHIAQTRHVLKGHRIAGQQRGAKFGQRGVFGTRDDDLAVEGLAAGDAELVHGVLSVSALGPFGRRVGFHRQGVHLVGFDAGAQGVVNLLVASDQTQTFKFGRDDGRPVAAVTAHLEVLTSQARGDDVLEFF